MAQLYRRYVPPPKQPVSSVASETPVRAAADTQGHKDDSQSRKRHRSEAEVAERKAKKLRRKDGDVADALPVPPSNRDHAEDADHHEPQDDHPTDEQQGSRGEFAHIKNTKKRHRLEKEARKARKAAEKGTNGQAEPVVSTEPSLQEVESHVTRGPDVRLEESTEHKTRDDTDETTADRHEPEHQDTPRVKKRRHRLESVLEQGAQTDEPSQEVDHLQKHGAVLNKLQKSVRRQRAVQPQQQGSDQQQSFEAPKVQDLVIPEPAQAQDDFTSTDSALPPWLADPIIISNQQESTFAALELESKTLERLSKLGFGKAQPVQQALIPLLLPPGISGSKHLPGTEACLPDIAVSAPTGSGKTIAYLVPILESLRANPDSGSIRALVVVPTRELVMQVAAVWENLAKGTSIKYGTATGAGNFRDESSRLVKRQRKYDPERYRELLQLAHRRNYPDLVSPDDDGTHSPAAFEDDNGERTKLDQEIQDTVSGLVDHVPVYHSAVDVLFATPGRLMEHLARTKGVSLDQLEWLVLDEADRLLDAQNDGLIQTIKDNTSKAMSGADQTQNRSLQSRETRRLGRARPVRKVMLSATMTKDISKLVDLNLQRPQLIVVRGEEQSGDSALSNAEAAVKGQTTNGDFELPTTLKEYSVHAGEGSEKPLVLVELLRRKMLLQYMGRTDDFSQDDSGDSDSEGDVEASDSESSSDSDQESSTEASSGTSDSESSSDGDNESASSDDDGSESNDADTGASQSLITIHPDRVTLLDKSPNAAPTILIFTSSTESANRLAYLLKALLSNLSDSITTMTRSNSKPNKAHGHVDSHDPVITISTDRASRGLDTIAGRPISHVVQYDVPRSATSYVHRVGRTARAGRPGEAWTLFTHTESRWFARAILRTKQIKRLSDVEKAKVTAADEDTREALGRAVAAMREEVMAPRKRK